MKTFRHCWYVRLALSLSLAAPAISDCPAPERVPQRSTHFDGTSASRMDFAAEPDFDQRAPMTVEAWVYREYDDGTEFVLAHGNLLSFALALVDDRLSFTRGSLLEARSTVPVLAGRWTHVAASYDGARVRFYLNGVPAGEFPLGGYVGPVNAGLSLGGHPVAGAPFSGNLDEVRLWSAARTQTEIRDNLWTELNSGPGLVAVFPGGSAREIVAGRLPTFNQGTHPDTWGILPRHLGVPLARGWVALDGVVDLEGEYDGAEQVVISYLGPDRRLRDARGYLVSTDPGTPSPTVYLGIRDVRSHDLIQPFDPASYFQVSVGAAPDDVGNPMPQYDLGTTRTVPTTRTISRLNRSEAPATLALWDARTFECRGDVEPPCFEFRLSSAVFNEFENCPRIRILQLHSAGGEVFLDASSLPGAGPDTPSPLGQWENWQPLFLLPPATPPLGRDDVRVLALEVNQAVQDTLFYPGPPGSSTVADSSLPLVPQRNTVVRAHVAGRDGVPHRGFSAVLQVAFHFDDGSAALRNYRPVNGGGEISLEGDAAPAGSPDTTQLQRLRFDLAHTLNFVIPEEDLVADQIGLTLFEAGRSTPLPLHGEVLIRLDEPIAIGLNVVRVRRTVEPRPLVPVTDDDILQVPLRLKRIYPVSRARLLRTQDWTYTGEPSDGALLSAIEATFLGDAVPSGYLPEPYFITTLGMARGLFDLVGLGRYNRGFAVSIETLAGYGHEIGHNLDLNHFGRSFGEDADSNDYREFSPEFGTITRFTDLRAALGIQADRGDGDWELSRPGSVPPATSLLPGEYGPFDIMSYGLPEWISDLNYRRIYGKIRGTPTERSRSRQPISLASSGTDPTVEAILVRGALEADGTGRLLPVLRKPIPADLLEQDDPNGRYRVEFRGTSDVLLGQTRFDPPRTSRHGDARAAHFNLPLPVVDGVQHLRLFAGTQLLAELRRSTNPPVLRVLSTAPVGEPPSQRWRVAWDTTDADGDAVTTLVQASFDGGMHWVGVALALPGDPAEAETAVPEWAEAGGVMFRVSASDGLDTVTEFTCAHPSLRIRRTVTYSWDCGILQSADDPSGPYVDVPGATSPFTTAIGPGRRYFRLR